MMLSSRFSGTCASAGTRRYCRISVSTSSSVSVLFAAFLLPAGLAMAGSSAIVSFAVVSFTAVSSPVVLSVIVSWEEFCLNGFPLPDLSLSSPLLSRRISSSLYPPLYSYILKRAALSF